ncbi:DUF6415 family natural product biosynthesis protein [Streptomyces achromogenes]|uniref:DUF6415 family natural product biosynthesis protein n=1 Tax=Streptomyces achromogenes TaxID=67255 RepID=UPI0036B1DDBE
MTVPPAVPDKLQILEVIETVLGWPPAGPHVPPADIALSLLTQLTAHGQVLARDLEAQCASVFEDSPAVAGARHTLGEAGRRLPLPLPAGPDHAVVHRAQNVARLVQALLCAVGRVGEEQARGARPEPVSPAGRPVTLRGRRGE